MRGDGTMTRFSREKYCSRTRYRVLSKACRNSCISVVKQLRRIECRVNEKRRGTDHAEKVNMRGNSDTYEFMVTRECSKLSSAGSPNV